MLGVRQQVRAMHIYWTLRSFPELRELEPRQQRVAWRACCLKPLRHWQTWAALFAVVPVIVVGAFVGSVIDGQTALWFGGVLPVNAAMRAPVAALVLIGVAGIIGFNAWIQVYCRIIRPHLKEYVDCHRYA